MPGGTTRAWRTVLERIETDLLEGRLGPGDRLPGERDLATQMGVGRSSVREAIRVLESMGLLRTASGSGPNAGAIITATPEGGMATLMRLQVAAKGFPFDEIVDTRVLLESAVVHRLANADEPDLGPAESTLQAMRDAALTPEEFLALDAQFHVWLAEASGNGVVASVMSGLRTAIESYARAGAALVDDWPAMVENLQREHESILDAIRAGDPELARTRIRDHIVGFYAATHAAHPNH